MQLKLNLFKESLDNYRKYSKGSKLNQEALQTGNPIGTYTRRDPHPWVEGLFYSKSLHGREWWAEEHKLPKRNLASQKRLQTGNPKGTFKIRDPHPTVAGLFYRCWNNNKEEWTTMEAINELRKTRYNWEQTEKRKEWNKVYEKTPKVKAKRAKYRKENPEKTRSRVAKYLKTDKGKAFNRMACNKRRARMQKASVNLTEYEEGIIKHIYAYAVRVSKKLNITFHVDHIVPISKGGLHHPMNLQVVPAVWNVRKNNRNTERWLPNGM